MGVSTWTQSLMQSDGAELPKPLPPTRRSHQQSELLKCPRCDSTNTKFCYYNNYNKSQPRHFCKACKRHWTKGGTLRNVPVGGGRKNKRLKTSNASSTNKASGAVTTNPTTNPTASSILPFGAFVTADNISSLSGKSFTGNNGSAPKDQNPEFQFSGLSTFDIDSSSLLIPSGNAYDYAGNCLDTAEESTITTVNPSTNSTVIEFPWGDPSTDIAMELPNYYWNNWNDIDFLTSADLINISWDDTEIKP